MTITQGSIDKAIRKAYGLFAHAESVREMFIPRKGWVPSLFKVGPEEPLAAYLQSLVNIGAEQVNLRIASDGCRSMLGDTSSDADFTISELSR